ncbi:hypothetical protein [Sinomicrobium oceani]|uniref:hypothetical protein n=1 Tax=Sinomicrobium oceani TaxID=1150368 RepID=UPI00227ABE02|nr:hypothetical protein [Sinomicrobium oceani]
MSDKYSFYQGDKEYPVSGEEGTMFHTYPDGHFPARYRCRQTNVTRIGGVPTFNSEIRKEYIVNYIPEKNSAHCQLQDYVFQADPKAFELPLEEMKPLEYSKENVSFEISDTGTISSIQNFRELQERWSAFRKKFTNTFFYQDIKKVNEKAADDILKTGDKEFSTIAELLRSYEKNMFYHILFKDYRPSNKSDSLTFMSQIFNDQKLNIPIVNSKASDKDGILIYRSVGSPDLKKMNKDEMIRQYDRIYKPVIKYNFTEYNYEYRIRRYVNKKDGIITSAKAVMIERIKNNYELISQFDLKQVAL